MKEKLYTIPLNDAMNAEDECPFCFIERNVEQDIMDYVLGSCASYMESDTRAVSYTHLDVYKRQPFPHGLSRPVW